MAAPNTTTTDLTNLIANAFDKKVDFALRPMAQLRGLVDTKVVSPTHDSGVYKKFIYSDLADATTPLNEVTDPTGSVIGNPTPVTVNLAEYGDFTVISKRLTEFSFADSVVQDAVNILARQQLTTVDKLVDAVLAASTNVITVEGGSVVATGNDVDLVEATDTIKSATIRRAVAKFRASSVMGRKGELFAAHIHPDVAHDLRAEAGSLGWRVPREYSDPSDIWAAETGTYEGAFFIENARVGVADNSESVPVYNTYIAGQGALLEVVADEFHTELNGTVADALNRKTVIGWRGNAGWALYRPESLTVIKTASSIA